MWNSKLVWICYTCHYQLRKTPRQTINIVMMLTLTIRMLAKSAVLQPSSKKSALLVILRKDRIAKLSVLQLITIKSF